MKRIMIRARHTNCKHIQVLKPRAYNGVVSVDREVRNSIG